MCLKQVDHNINPHLSPFLNIFILTSVQSATQCTIGLSYHFNISHYINEIRGKGNRVVVFNGYFDEKNPWWHRDSNPQPSDSVLVSTGLGHLACKASPGSPQAGSHASRKPKWSPVCNWKLPQPTQSMYIQLSSSLAQNGLKAPTKAYNTLF